VTTIDPIATGAETTPELPEAGAAMTLSEAINVVGVPTGVSPSDVGNTINLPLSEAAMIIGIPPGMSPSDVGKTTVSPLPVEAGKRP